MNDKICLSLYITHYWAKDKEINGLHLENNKWRPEWPQARSWRPSTSALQSVSNSMLWQLVSLSQVRACKRPHVYASMGFGFPVNQVV